MQYYGLERFLYRFSQSEHRDRFVLKGALLLRIWNAPESPPTRDIDFLGYVDNSIERVVRVARDVCQVEVEDDGLRFDVSTIAGERIKEDADYEGVIVKFIGFLEKARIPMQLDVAFGDVVNPSAEEYNRLMALVRRGVIHTNQVTDFAPWRIARTELDSEPVRALVEILKATGKLPPRGGSPQHQRQLFPDKSTFPRKGAL